MAQKLMPFLIVLLLSGCLLQQNKPEPTTPPVSVTLSGIVRVEDYFGPENQAYIKAQFVESKEEGSRALKANLSRAKTTECVYEAKDRSAAAAAALIPVGDLYFGPALQSTQLKIPTSEAGLYYQKLDPGIESGQYMVAATGTDKWKGFQEYLSMPGQVVSPKMGDDSFNTSDVHFKLNEAPVVSWEAPNAVSGDEGIMIFEATVQTEKKLWDVFCVAAEKEIEEVEGRRVWKLDLTETQKMPAANIAIFYLTRAYVKSPQRKDLKFQMQGWRTHYTLGQIRSN